MRLRFCCMIQRKIGVEEVLVVGWLVGFFWEVIGTGDIMYVYLASLSHQYIICTPPIIKPTTSPPSRGFPPRAHPHAACVIPALRSACMHYMYLKDIVSSKNKKKACVLVPFFFWLSGDTRDAVMYTGYLSVAVRITIPSKLPSPHSTHPQC